MAKAKQGKCKHKKCGNIATITVENGVFTECKACYDERKKYGYVKKDIDASNEIAALAAYAIKESCVNIYKDIDMKDMMKPVVSTKTTNLSNGSTIVVQTDPMSFFNKRTEEYNMLNGDNNMMKKVVGFRLTDVVDSKYFSQVLLLSEAINENNAIVCIESIAPGEDLKGLPPANDEQIARMLGYKDAGKRYKQCMKHLIEVGVIFKFKNNDAVSKCVNTIYFFNPVYQNAGKGVSPSLFFMFFKSFQDMAQKNKEFKFRFNTMAEYAFTWIMHKRSDFKELQSKYNRYEISQVEIAKGVTEIFAKIADSYNIPVSLETNVEVDTTNMSLYESVLAKADSNVKFNNLDKFDNEVEDIDIELEDDLTEIDKPVLEVKPKAVTTKVNVQRTVTVNGKPIPMPINKPKVKNPVIKSLLKTSSDKPFDFSDDIYDFVEDLNKNRR